MAKHLSLIAALAVALVGCSDKRKDQESADQSGGEGQVVAPAGGDPVILSIIGTNDVHGALDRLPILAGFVDNLRKARATDGGVLLIDAGDMFQGSLESNMNEGAAMVDGYNALGYTAAVIGNHEFDFGPVGEASTAQGPEDNPRGALEARLAQAEFPILAANYIDEATGAQVDWKNAPPSAMREIAGVKVGIIGVSTLETPRVTMAANIVGVTMAPLAETIAAEAQALRQEGARVVIVTAHAGGNCKDLDKPDDLSSCRMDEEIVQVAQALPEELVDVIVAGHTHRAMAHRVNGIAIIESYSKLRAFGRVDLRVPRDGSPVSLAAIYQPHELCPGEHRVAAKDCQPGSYEGAPVTPVAAIAEVIAPAMKDAQVQKVAPVGIVLDGPVERQYARESQLGNLFADLIREARGTDIAITNGGGLRADLPAGPLSYGALYEAMPFDNRFATIQMSAAELADVFAANLALDAGILSISGARVRATCEDGALAVQLLDERGKPMAPKRALTVATSDFLATGGDDGPFSKIPAEAIALNEEETLRDGMARALAARGGTLASASLYDAKAPRLVYPGERPIRCSK